MNTLREDTTGTQEVVGALIFSVLLVASLSAGYVVVQDRVEDEHAPDATVEQSSIEAKSTDQLEIKPLVGDDVNLEDAEVRVIFEDRNAPDAVLTNLQGAKDHSTQVQVSDTQTIQTAGDYEPINQTVTYYEQNGTTDEVELDTYKWEKEVKVPVRVKKWKVWNVTDAGHKYDSVRRTTTEGKPSRFDGGYSKGFLIVWETKKEGLLPSTYKTRECVAVREDRSDTCYYPRVTKAKRWHTVNETRNATVEYPEKPGEDWEKVYTWEKTESHKEPSKVRWMGQVWNMSEMADWFDPYKTADEIVENKTVTTTLTKNATTKPGPGWEKQAPVKTGVDTYKLDQPAPKYDEKQKEVTVGYRITNTTQEVDRTRTVYVASENAPEADTDDDSMLATLAPVGIAEGGWADDVDSAWDDFYGDYESNSKPSETSDTTSTDESSDSDSFLDDGRYVDSDDSQEGGDGNKDVDDPDTGDIDTDRGTGDPATGSDADTDNDGDANAGPDADASDGDPAPADQTFDTANENAAFLVDEDTPPTRNSAIGMGGTVGSEAASTWTQGESVVVQLDRPLLFEGERVTVQIVDSETNSLVMDRTVRIQDTKRFQFGPDGSGTVTDDPAPGENVTVNGSVGTPNGTLGDLPNVSTDPGDGGSTPGDSDDGTSDSNPDVGTGDGDGEGERQPKADLDCGFSSRTASGGYACVGDQTGSNDDSSTGGYTKACSDDTNCAPAGSSGSPSSEIGDGGDGDGSINPAFPDVGSGGGSSGGGGGSSGGGGGSSGGGTVGGGSSGGGYASGGNGNSGAVGPGM